jgi:uncharacterized protein (TIGR03084 family)
MEAIVQELGEQHDELDALLSAMDGTGWDRAVPDCPGWTVADVVLHLAQTDELVVASARDELSSAVERMTGSAEVAGETVDDLVDRMVDHERGASGPEVHDRWRAASAAMRSLLAASDPRQRIPWVVTDLSARTMATTRLSECWIHTHDVAGAMGANLPATGRLWHIARLAWRTIPYAFARAGASSPAGPVAAVLTAPDGGTWSFGADQPAPTTVTGPAIDFCLVAGRRLDPRKSALTAEGPDAEKVLTLLRTYA